MKRNTKILVVRNIVSVTLICIVCILFLSFLLQGNTDYNYEQENVNNPSNSPHIDVLPNSNDIPALLWTRTWGGTGMDSAGDLALDSSENIYVVGQTNSSGAGNDDIVLVKYNSIGQPQWNTTWGGVGDDWGRSLVIDSSDNIFIVGITHSFGPGHHAIALIKYNSLGEQQWNTTWGSGFAQGDGISLDLSGNIFITGSIGTSKPYPDTGDMVLVKFSSLGEYQWNKTWSGGHVDIGAGMTMDSSDNIFITGFIFSYGAGVGDAFLLKYNSSGDLQWDNTWGGVGFSLELDSSNNIFVVGMTSSFDAGNQDISILKFNSLGQLQWNKTWGGTGIDTGWGLALDSSENIYITGGSNSSSAGDSDIVLVKYNSIGQPQWNTTWGGADDDWARSLVIDSSDNIFIVGSTDSFGAGMSDVVLVKYGPDIYNPVITINNPNQNDAFGVTAPDFDISIIEPNLDTTWYTLDGGTTNITFSGLTGTINQTEWNKKGNGTVTIGFYANDTGGLESFAEIQVLKDTTDPIITDTPSDFSVEYGYTGVSLSWTATDPNPYTYTIELQGFGIVAGSSPWLNDTEITYNVPDGLAVGDYIYIVNFTDDAGNFMTDSVTMTVEDTTDPMLTNMPSNFTVDYGYTGKNIMWTATDPYPHTYTIELQGSGTVAGPTAWSSGVAITYNVPDGLAVGDYIYTVNFTDQYGNSVIDTITLTVREVSNGGGAIPLELIIIISSTIGGAVVIAVAIVLLTRRRRKLT